MALFPKTPGVYIQEIPVLPASVAAVPTAIPVFIGYTEIGTLNKATRVDSLLEYQKLFGNAHNEKFKVTLTTANVNIASVFNTPLYPEFRLFYHLQMYFANGGGPCYIISVGHYTATSISGTALHDAIQYAEEVDEITLVVVPEAMAVLDGPRKTIYDEMLAHCAKMQDRFAIMDVEVRGGTIFNDSDLFRNNNVGTNNLKYGASYYPSIESALSFAYLDTDVAIVATDTTLPSNVKNFNNKTLATVKSGSTATGSITINNGGLSSGAAITIGSLTPPIDLYALDDPNPNVIAASLASFINGNAPYNTVLVANNVTATNLVTLTTLQIGAAGNYTITPNTQAAPDVTVVSFTGGSDPDTLLYGRITADLSVFPMNLYLSATMAGVYAAVDNDRGVWKAPANLSLNRVDKLNVVITDQDQEGLNVDPSSGKSINAVRDFIGRGTLVWGARTLAGNDNEWRYINVRRLFIFAEDSIKHASEFVVFEPNDKNTWVRVKGMITNFLTDLWKNGALAGDKPEQAFFVKIGLNETMTPQDILEGKLIIQIGLAAVRPAEFIILQFMHKLQEA